MKAMESSGGACAAGCGNAAVNAICKVSAFNERLAFIVRKVSVMTDEERSGGGVGREGSREGVCEREEVIDEEERVCLGSVGVEESEMSASKN